MSNKTLDERGTSLIEMMIVIVVTAVILLSVTMSLAISQKSLKANEAAANTNKVAAKYVEELLQELRFSRIIHVETGGGALTFEVPIDGDEDGTALDENGNVEWGMRWLTGGRARIAFVPKYETTEYELGTDIDGDGARDGHFEVGNLVMEVLDGSGYVVTTRPLGPTKIARRTGSTLYHDSTPVFEKITANGRPLIKVCMIAIERDGTAVYANQRELLVAVSD